MSANVTDHRPQTRRLSQRRRCIQWRAARRRYFRKLAAQRQAAGLTTRGTAPVRPRRQELDHLHGRQRRNARLAIYRAANLQLGLTTCGLPRQRRGPPGLGRNDYMRRRTADLNARGLSARGTPLRWRVLPTEQELAWQKFRMGIEVPVCDFLSTGERGEA